VLADGDGSRLVWIADVLPHAAAETVRAMMEAGIQAAKAKLNELS
jgi:hypothetical protein